MLRRWIFIALSFALASGVVEACVSRPFPGSEVMGSFNFTAAVTDPPVPGTCAFPEMPTANFTFNGTFSQNPDGGAFFTLGENDRTATFDGQVISTFSSAPRVFNDCGCPHGTTMNETLTVSLLSRSQRNALPDPTRCPDNPLDGGTPPVGGDITGPGSNGISFDAVLACGFLTDEVVVSVLCEGLADGGGTCDSCTITYPVQGGRR